MYPKYKNKEKTEKNKSPVQNFAEKKIISQNTKKVIKI
jgi:hypothetical protein